MWRQSWWVAGKELKYMAPAFLFTTLATIFLAVMAGTVLETYFHGQYVGEPRLFNRIFLDMYFLGITPSLSALFMSGPYLSLRTIKEDPFGRRMAFLRSLPIPILVLVRSRMLIMLATFLPLTLVFYSSIYLSLSLFKPDAVYLSTFLDHFGPIAVTWTGYALLLGGVNTYVEYGTNGRMLYVTALISYLLLGAILSLVYFFSPKGVFGWSFDLVQNYGWLAAASSLMIGIAGYIVWQQLLARRLRQRDYA